jgi:hypothetical protein
MLKRGKLFKAKEKDDSIYRAIDIRQLSKLYFRRQKIVPLAPLPTYSKTVDSTRKCLTKDEIISLLEQQDEVLRKLDPSYEPLLDFSEAQLYQCKKVPTAKPAWVVFERKWTKGKWVSGDWDPAAEALPALPAWWKRVAHVVAPAEALPYNKMTV